MADFIVGGGTKSIFRDYNLTTGAIGTTAEWTGDFKINTNFDPGGTTTMTSLSQTQAFWDFREEYAPVTTGLEEIELENGSAVSESGKYLLHLCKGGRQGTNTLVLVQLCKLEATSGQFEMASKTYNKLAITLTAVPAQVATTVTATMIETLDSNMNATDIIIPIGHSFKVDLVPDTV